MLLDTFLKSAAFLIKAALEAKELFEMSSASRPAAHPAWGPVSEMSRMDQTPYAELSAISPDDMSPGAVAARGRLRRQVAARQGVHPWSIRPESYYGQPKPTPAVQFYPPAGAKRAPIRPIGGSSGGNLLGWIRGLFSRGFKR